MKIPEEVIEIGSRIAADDKKNDHFTQHPMFCLQVLVRDIGFDSSFNDTKCWLKPEDQEVVYDDDECVKCLSSDHIMEWALMDGEDIVYLDDKDSEWEGPYGYQDRWETVMVAFTEKGLQNYMTANGHNVRAQAFRGKTRVYVESFNRCREMIEIRKHLMQSRDED